MIAKSRFLWIVLFVSLGISGCKNSELTEQTSTHDDLVNQASGSNSKSQDMLDHSDNEDPEYMNYIDEDDIYFGYNDPIFPDRYEKEVKYQYKEDDNGVRISYHASIGSNYVIYIDHDDKAIDLEDELKPYLDNKSPYVTEYNYEKVKTERIVEKIDDIHTDIGDFRYYIDKNDYYMNLDSEFSQEYCELAFCEYGDLKISVKKWTYVDNRRFYGSIRARSLAQLIPISFNVKSYRDEVIDNMYLSCVFPHSSDDLISEKDLQHLVDENDDDSLRYAEYEIYARHGKAFYDDTEIQEYFGDQNWYWLDSRADEIILSDIESKNIELIKKYRSKLDNTPNFQYGDYTICGLYYNSAEVEEITPPIELSIKGDVLKVSGTFLYSTKHSRDFHNIKSHYESCEEIVHLIINDNVLCWNYDGHYRYPASLEDVIEKTDETKHIELYCQNGIIYEINYSTNVLFDYFEIETEPDFDNEATNKLSESYIFPDSDKRLLTEKDLKGLSNIELRYGRNEIVARHGRKFDDEELQEFFNSKPWYKGTKEVDKFNESSELNDIEKENMSFIIAHENTSSLPNIFKTGEYHIAGIHFENNRGDGYSEPMIVTVEKDKITISGLFHYIEGFNTDAYNGKICKEKVTLNLSPTIKCGHSDDEGIYYTSKEEFFSFLNRSTLDLDLYVIDGVVVEAIDSP